ncbi:MAG: tungsten cofactor oxidoreductase radical SAM maturase [Thermoplasmata archaeon]
MVKFVVNNAKINILSKLDLKKLYIELTSSCNLSCKMCYRRFWSEKTGMMNDSTFKNILDQISEFKNLDTVHFGGIGEPLFHPKFLEYARIIKDLGYKLHVSTNGTLLNDHLAEELIQINTDFITFSFDSSEDETFMEIRGIDKSIVFRNMKNIADKVRAKNKEYPKLELEIVAMKSNIDQLPKIAELGGQIGVSRILISNLLPMSPELVNEIVYDSEIDQTYINEFLKSSRVNRIGVLLPEFSLKTERICDFMQKKSTVIGWDGEVSPCYRFLHSYPEYIYGRLKNVNRFSFGNVNSKRLSEIWNSDEYQRFRWNVENSAYPSCIDCVFSNAKCYFVSNTDIDCTGNAPSCGDCLWSRRLILCP